MIPQRQVQLHAFELAGVIKAITQPPFMALVKSKAIESVDMDTTDFSGLLVKAKEQLIDDFIQNAINSFQCCFVMGYAPYRNTQAELEWMAFHNEARSLLYDTLNLPVEASGMHVGYRRIGSVIYLAIPIN
ncbi:hypothetical protein [Pseudomonas phage PA1C]|uniref:Uncharacterized protein n=2 Tax=root TaxID=1 RepID=A0A5C1K7N0_9CAUD|nr:hypothetical protein PP933_gp040 [Pseudomonas phage vB_PaeM_PS119XW]QBX32191.1 hypothetical protein [Pseudomonas phage PA1C]QEM41769.1 hypothetical protein [Pseudomonas phage vB_PaeM_PS119XW]BEG72679.1 hypothetical protein RVBP21_3070 [Pseudomonas phage BRkr]